MSPAQRIAGIRGRLVAVEGMGVIPAARPADWYTEDVGWLLGRVTKLEAVAKAAEGTRRAGRTPSSELDRALAELDAPPMVVLDLGDPRTHGGAR